MLHSRELKILMNNKEQQNLQVGDADEFLKRYADGDREFQKISLCKAKLAGHDLRRINLLDADLREANLDGADLRGAHLERANLFGACLRGSDLSGAFFKEVNLTQARLRGAKLCGVISIDTDLSNVDFTGADLKGSDWIGCNLSNTNFSSSDLRGATVFSLYMNSSTAFFGADLRAAEFYDLGTGSASFDGSDLRGAKLNGLEMNSASFDGADLRGAQLCDLNISSASFIEADLRGSRRATEFEKPNNQGLPFNQRQLYSWEGLRFRSKTEIKIAQAFDRVAVLFLPNCLARLSDSVKPEGRGNKEADFLVCHQGKWGILEVDGPYHVPERRVEEQERERLFKLHGIRVIERFDASICYKQPDEVVRQFLEMIERLH